MGGNKVWKPGEATPKYNNMAATPGVYHVSTCKPETP